MPRPATLLLVLAAAACGRGSMSIGEAGGRLTFTGSTSKHGARQLVSAPASASWCADDTSLAIIVVTSHGEGGTAARLHWPLGAPGTYTVGRRLGPVGTATVAWRPVDDTVRIALVADSGQVTLRKDGPVSVSGSLTAWARVRDTVTRLDGTLSRIPVASWCGSPR